MFLETAGIEPTTRRACSSHPLEAVGRFHHYAMRQIDSGSARSVGHICVRRCRCRHKSSFQGHGLAGHGTSTDLVWKQAGSTTQAASYVQVLSDPRFAILRHEAFTRSVVFRSVAMLLSPARLPHLPLLAYEATQILTKSLVFCRRCLGGLLLLVSSVTPRLLAWTR
jgi:hypothetical protein